MKTPFPRNITINTALHTTNIMHFICGDSILPHVYKNKKKMYYYTLGNNLKKYINLNIKFHLIYHGHLVNQVRAPATISLPLVNLQIGNVLKTQFSLLLVVSRVITLITCVIFIILTAIPFIIIFH